MKTWKKHFASFWWVYVLIFFLSLVFWHEAFRKALETPPEKQLRIAVVADELDTAALEERLLAALQKDGECPIEDVSVSLVNFDDDSLRAQAVWARSKDADLVIFAEEYLFDHVGSAYFAALPADFTGEIYQEEDRAYGAFLPSLLEKPDARFCLFFTSTGATRQEVQTAAKILISGG